MSYTLTKWALWLVAAALVGAVVGWLLRGLRRGPDIVASEAEPGELDRRDEREIELQATLADLEAISAERERLRVALAECHARTLAATAGAEREAASAGERAARPADAGGESDRLAALVAEQAATIGDLRARLWNHEARIAELQNVLAAHSAATAPPDPDLDAGAEVLGEKIRLNDLTLVEGIGPKIADLLRNDAGIRTWWDLHQADVGALRALLADAGPRFQVHDPVSWPQQAGQLARGQWQEFKTLSDRLKGGRSARR